MYVRGTGDRLTVSTETVTRWKKLLTATTLADFTRLRNVVWNRTDAYLPDVARAIASSYKSGLDVFDSHFDLGDQKHVLQEPRVLQTARRADRKNAAFVLGILSSMVADGRKDRLAILVIGLGIAQKIPHWAGYKAAETDADYWSETDAEYWSETDSP